MCGCLMLLFFQLDMITDLLGTPSLDDVKHITSRKSIRNLLSRHKPAASQQLYALSPNGTISHEAVHLLSQLLIFNPVSSGCVS